MKPQTGTTPAIMALPTQTEMAVRALAQNFTWKFREHIEPVMLLHERDRDRIFGTEIMALLVQHEEGLRKLAERWEKLAKDLLGTQLTPPIVIEAAQPPGILVTREQLEGIQWAGDEEFCPACGATQNHADDCWIGKALAK